MKTKSLFSIVGALALLLMAGTASATPLAAPLGTAFTYQGRLTVSGSPANGSYDLQFMLFDAVTSGTQVGSTVNKGSVAVTDGLFTVQLDFGDAFDGAPLWLEIGVATGGSGGPYTTLAPRQPLTPTPYAIFAARAPWSGLTGVPAGFADDVDDTGGHYQNVVVVAKGGGDFTSIQDALNSIADASDTNRYLVRVMPGVYDEEVGMKPYVDIEGSGELTTKITLGGSAIVLGASDAELRFLTVENTGGGSFAYAVYNSSASPRLTHVTAIATGGTSVNYGVYNSDSSPTMTNVTANASGGADHNSGVYNSNSSSPTMTNVVANASGGLYSYGVWNDSSSPTITGGTATASGATYNVGIVNSDSPAVISGVTASGSGGTIAQGVSNLYSSATISNSILAGSGATTNYGIDGTDAGPCGGCVTVVTNSKISGDTSTAWTTPYSSIYVGGSQLSGGSASGNVYCAGVFDEAFTFFSETCP